VIVAGSPPGTPGKTNALRVHRIGDALFFGDPEGRF
jgi:pyruvate kinase